MTIGAFRHRVTLANPGTPQPDGTGGYVDTWSPLDPADWNCSIDPATAGNAETIAADTVTANATHVIRGWFHPGITNKTRVTFNGRTLNVVHVANRGERDIVTELVCAEVVA